MHQYVHKQAGRNNYIQPLHCVSYKLGQLFWFFNQVFCTFASLFNTQRRVKTILHASQFYQHYARNEASMISLQLHRPSDSKQYQQCWPRRQENPDEIKTRPGRQIVVHIKNVAYAQFRQNPAMSRNLQSNKKLFTFGLSSTILKIILCEVPLATGIAEFSIQSYGPKNLKR